MRENQNDLYQSTRVRPLRDLQCSSCSRHLSFYIPNTDSPRGFDLLFKEQPNVDTYLKANWWGHQRDKMSSRRRNRKDTPWDVMDTG